jgi:hypothetical protein
MSPSTRSSNFRISKLRSTFEVWRHCMRSFWQSDTDGDIFSEIKSQDLADNRRSRRRTHIRDGGWLAETSIRHFRTRAISIPIDTASLPWLRFSSSLLRQPNYISLHLSQLDSKIEQTDIMVRLCGPYETEGCSNIHGIGVAKTLHGEEYMC